MNDTKMIMGSLALDLKRAALFYHSGSMKTADRFYNEALKRISELDRENLKPYINKHLDNIKKIGYSNNDNHGKAENALMYSAIIQNYCLTYC